MSCWYTPAGQTDLAGALRQLTQTFGPQGKDAVLVTMATRVTTDRSDNKKTSSVAVVHAQRDGAWTVASWLVAHAQQYGISQIRYAGYVWNAANGSMGWQRARAQPGHEPGARQYCRGLSRHQPNSRHTVLAAGTRTTKELTRDLHHRAALR